ncbi:hypothetical protein BGZ83_011545 [Gryganskiella cystojenkinii]|nr:hypothetical protein BGZ83_011545 [Gryganskiella cystojenkinii]
MNNIFAGHMYNKPFFVTYVNTASFSLYLLGPAFRHWYKHGGNARSWAWFNSGEDTSGSSAKSASESASDHHITSYGSVSQADPNQTLQHSIIAVTSPTISSCTVVANTQDQEEATLEQGSIQSSVGEDEPPLSHREVAELSFAFCILWFAANWATNASLAYTTVASSTILASMSGFFTLAIGAILKTESFSTLKFMAVCASVLGVAFVSESDRGEGSSSNPPPITLYGHPGMHIDPPKAPLAPLFGDFLALMSAMFYGCYTVLLKVRIQNESRVNMSLFFGFVGLFNLVLLWPMFGVLHWTGIEPFELPSDTKVIWMIGINALIGTFVSDYLWLLSMLMTSPLVVTLGLSLTIPLALLGDVVGYGRVLGLGYWIGAGLVLAGFFGVNGVALSERDEADRLEEVAIRSAASCTTAAVAASALASEERLRTEQGHSRSHSRSRSRSTSEQAPLLSSVSR